MNISFICQIQPLKIMRIPQFKSQLIIFDFKKTVIQIIMQNQFII